MASLPPQASQRRPSSTEEANSVSESDNGQTTRDTEQSASHTSSAGSEDSQTVILNQPTDISPEVDTIGVKALDLAAVTSNQAEPRHCWICLQDEGDEGSNTEWRSPCPCNLQAHEECMLEWIADLEAPNARVGTPASKILCPQCKAEIHIARPRDLIVSAMGLVNSIARVLVLPAGLSALFGCLFSGSMAYGINAVYLVLGKDDAYVLLSHPGKGFARPRSLLGDRWYFYLSKVSKIANPFLPFDVMGLNGPENLALFLGLPMIAPTLILSRTSIADHVFAVLPISYFVTRPEDLDIRHWPPSQGLTFAVLPYIRLAYNKLYKYTFADLEKKWDLAVQRKPREGETPEQVVQAQNERAAGDAGGVIEFEIEIGDIQEHQEPVPQEIQAQPADQAAQAQELDPAGFEQPGQNGLQVEAQADQQPARQPNRQAGLAGEWAFASTAGQVLGALFFPAVSSLMGDLLKLTLPTKWVTKPVVDTSRFWSRRGSIMTTLPPVGLLQEQWGRNIVGGCLFVVLKDALILYCKWKRAKNQENRRVLDYVKKDGPAREAT